ncbi:MAG: hypothetical protein BTN85_1184 [Candidatus Methanohalarchaeum thermophilum]|uniref:Uncharacterized protein n=1 Tax=Methanohalarchaeum thermophilum TaxID=1903181 RepID=A0A1Q6DWG1_METT1|nr:MAG: hypothetical protein BTN85_1184 [Candidatus Methanohalarchaeum thermophilum]
MKDDRLNFYYPGFNLIKDFLEFFIFTWVIVGVLTEVMVEDVYFLSSSFIRLGGALFLWFVFLFTIISIARNQIKSNPHDIEGTNIKGFVKNNSISTLKLIFYILLVFIGLILIKSNLNMFAVSLNYFFHSMFLLLTEGVFRFSFRINYLVSIFLYVIGGTAFTHGIDRIVVYLLRNIINNRILKKGSQT